MTKQYQNSSACVGQRVSGMRLLLNVTFGIEFANCSCPRVQTWPELLGERPQLQTADPRNAGFSTTLTCGPRQKTLLRIESINIYGGSTSGLRLKQSPQPPDRISSDEGRIRHRCVQRAVILCEEPVPRLVPVARSSLQFLPLTGNPGRRTLEVNDLAFRDEPRLPSRTLRPQADVDVVKIGIQTLV